MRPAATHAPLQAPRSWIDQFKGKFDVGGRVPQISIQRQKKLGVVPPENCIGRRAPAELPSWNSLSDDQKKVATRLMEALPLHGPDGS